MDNRDLSNRAMKDFIAPQPNRALIRFLYLVLPPLARKLLSGFSVQIEDASIQKLEAVRGERWLLIPNHPAHWDALVMLELSKRLDKTFYYLVAREVFDIGRGMLGWLLRRVGCYSLVRGSTDIASFKMTREILTQNKGPLVVFMEGRISHRNEAILPLEPGVLHLAFVSLKEMYKRANNNLEALPPLYVFPLAIKYFYSEEKLDEEIALGIQRLEQAMGIEPQSSFNEQRIRDICWRVFQEIARQHNHPLDGDTELTQGMASLIDAMLTRLEQLMNLPVASENDFVERSRQVWNMVEKAHHRSAIEETVYQRRLAKRQKVVLKAVCRELREIKNLNAIFEGYVYSQNIKTRQIELIRQLETEVFGVTHFCHPKMAVLKVLEPLELKQHFETFLQDKKSLEARLVREIESALYQGIHSTELLRSDTR